MTWSGRASPRTIVVGSLSWEGRSGVYAMHIWSSDPVVRLLLVVYSEFPNFRVITVYIILHVLIRALDWSIISLDFISVFHLLKKFLVFPIYADIRLLLFSWGKWRFHLIF